MKLRPKTAVLTTQTVRFTHVHKRNSLSVSRQTRNNQGLRSLIVHLITTSPNRATNTPAPATAISAKAKLVRKGKRPNPHSVKVLLSRVYLRGNTIREVSVIRLHHSNRNHKGTQHQRDRMKAEAPIPHLHALRHQVAVIQLLHVHPHRRQVEVIQPLHVLRLAEVHQVEVHLQEAAGHLRVETAGNIPKATN